MAPTGQETAVDVSKREEGFTLIELMVVVLIIAVLIAIAIPTFLGLRRGANDVAAKGTATTALKAAKAIFSDTDSYAPVTLAELRNTEVSISYVDGATASNGSLIASVNVPVPSTFVASVYSASGTCFFIRDDTNGTTYATLNTGTADCYAGNVAVVFGGSWP
jgi:type IV pilus assembly protein PilA